MVITPSVRLYLGFLALLYLERGVELLVSRRNAKLALARGGVEIGKRHYFAMVAVHALFPAVCGAEVVFLRRPFPGALGFIALALALLAQALRWWAAATLGPRWNTRVIVVPGSAPVTRGPYRAMRHPNYLAVLVEAAAVPLVHGAWLAALVFFAANTALLAIRIPAEERAEGPAYTAAFAGRRRLLPGARHE
jgi:methyltransferase